MSLRRAYRQFKGFVPERKKIKKGRAFRNILGEVTKLKDGVHERYLHATKGYRYRRA